MREGGSSAAQIGLVAILLRASSLLARPLGGRLLDRFGRRFITAVGAYVTIVVILSLFLFPRLSMPFLLMRILQGIGTSLVDSGLSTLVADLSPPGARTQVFGIYTAWMNLASVLMTGAGEMIARRAGFFSLFGTAALAVTAGLVTVRRLPETWRPRQEEAKPVPGLLIGAAPLLPGGVVVGLAYGVLRDFVPGRGLQRPLGGQGCSSSPTSQGSLASGWRGPRPGVVGSSGCLVTCIWNDGRRPGRITFRGFVDRVGKRRSGLRGQPVVS